MSTRRSGLHALLNSTETAADSRLQHGPGTGASHHNDSFMSSPSSSLSPTTPKKLHAPVNPQVEAGLDGSFGQPEAPAASHPVFATQNQHMHLIGAPSCNPTPHPNLPPHHLPMNGTHPSREPPNTPPATPSLSQAAGDKLLVSIDTYSASREACGKRQKNADASARYRRRKADQAAEEKTRIAQLEEENRYLGGRVIELTRQKEFYRDERRALREMMLAVPALEGAARERPDSPRPTVEGV